MTAEIEKQALETARRVAEGLLRDGAEAVILTGSWARGDAHRESDLDIRVVGEGGAKKLLRKEGFLVSIGWSTESDNEEMFSDPAEVGSIVPGWRTALTLVDPSGKASKLQRRAERWTWAEIEKDADEYVAREITKLGEEIHTLFTNLQLEIFSAAAATRVLIVAKLVPVMSVHLRLLYASEKELWDSVAENMGSRWRDLQERALGENDDNFTDGCGAAFELFLVAVDAVKDLLDEQQREVVEHAAGLAKRGSEAR